MVIPIIIVIIIIIIIMKIVIGAIIALIVNQAPQADNPTGRLAADSDQRHTLTDVAGNHLAFSCRAMGFKAYGLEMLGGCGGFVI